MLREQPEPAPILIAAFGSNVFGMHPRTGERLWRQEIGGGGTARLAIVGDRLYALGSDLVCLDYATGRVLWRALVDSTFLSGTMLVHGSFVFLADVGELIAFSADTGKQLWHDKFKGEGMAHVALAVPGVVAQADRSS